MRLEVQGESLASQVQFASLLAQKATDMAVRSFEVDGKTEVKLAPDGRPVHRTSLQGMRVQDGVPVSPDRSVSLSLIEPVDVLPGRFYTVSGKTWVTHYVDNSERIAVSVVAERVRPVQAPVEPKQA